MDSKAIRECSELIAGSELKHGEVVINGRVRFLWKTVVDTEFLDAVLVGDNVDERTSWHVLSDKYLGDLKEAFYAVESRAAGDVVDELEAETASLLEELSGLDRLLGLAKRVSHSKTDPDELFSSILAELPADHFQLFCQFERFMPDVQIPILIAMKVAYAAGHLPFGVVDGSVSESHEGPPILLCLDCSSAC